MCLIEVSIMIMNELTSKIISKYESYRAKSIIPKETRNFNNELS
jgi:hypothetical protein